MFSSGRCRSGCLLVENLHSAGYLEGGQAVSLLGPDQMIEESSFHIAAVVEDQVALNAFVARLPAIQPSDDFSSTGSEPYRRAIEDLSPNSPIGENLSE